MTICALALRLQMHFIHVSLVSVSLWVPHRVLPALNIVTLFSVFLFHLQVLELKWGLCYGTLVGYSHCLRPQVCTACGAWGHAGCLRLPSPKGEHWGTLSSRGRHIRCNFTQTLLWEVIIGLGWDALIVSQPGWSAVWYASSLPDPFSCSNTDIAEMPFNCKKNLSLAILLYIKKSLSELKQVFFGTQSWEFNMRTKSTDSSCFCINVCQQKRPGRLREKSCLICPTVFIWSVSQQAWNV